LSIQVVFLCCTGAVLSIQVVFLCCTGTVLSIQVVFLKDNLDRQNSTSAT
jgi:hypothetical protein